MSTPSVAPIRGGASSRGAPGLRSGRPTTRDPSVSGASFAPARAPRQTACFASSTERVNIADKFLSGGGLRKLVLSDEEQKQLLGAVAKHLRVLQEIPDFLPHLHVDADAVEVRASEVCDGRGVFATNAQLVERAVQLIELMGATVIGPDGAREKLNLKKRG